MEEEKRSHKRYLVKNIRGNMLFASDVGIINLSLGGAAIEADRRLNIGREYTLNLESSYETVSVRGKVVWSVISGRKGRPGAGDIPVYRAGLQFLDVLNHHSRELLDFLDKNRISEGARMRGGRIMLTPREHTATLNFPFSYTVLDPSVNGMRLLTDHEFSSGDLFDMEVFLGEDLPVPFKGRVASCGEVEEEDTKRYEVGIEFVNIPDASKIYIEEFIKTLRS
jgi:Tfp pilus assembly protein PilZ